MRDIIALLKHPPLAIVQRSEQTHYCDAAAAISAQKSRVANFQISSDST
jgi:hypothetical protein